MVSLHLLLHTYLFTIVIFSITVNFLLPYLRPFRSKPAACHNFLINNKYNTPFRRDHPLREDKRKTTL